MRKSQEGFNHPEDFDTISYENQLHSSAQLLHTQTAPGPRGLLLADAHNGHVDDTAVWQKSFGAVWHARHC